MDKEELLPYESPLLKVEEVQLEQGFMVSSANHEGFGSSDGVHEGMEESEDYTLGFD